MPDDSSDSESKKIDEITDKSSDLSESNRLCRDSDDVDESE